MRRVWLGVVGVAGFLGVGGILGNQLWGWFQTDVIDRERITLTVERDPGRYLRGAPNWESFEWVFPSRNATTLGPPPTDVCRDRWRWAQRLNGIDALQTQVRVYMTGDGVEDVLLDGIRVQVRERARPAAGAYATCRVGGASASPRAIYIDLDRRQPKMTFDQGGENYTKTFAFAFPKGKSEREIFDIIAWSTKRKTTWQVEFSFLIGEKRVARTVPERGYFTTTGVRAAEPLEWDGSRWRRAAPP
jgi:hypothetical protein